jgi:hypothetical protein
MRSCFSVAIQFIPLQIIKTSVELNEEYQVENILEKWMISEKPTISSSEKDTIPQKTHENSENLLNCARTLQQFERGLSQQKLELIDFSKESRLEGLKKFSCSQFHCYHCSVQKQHSKLWRLRKTHSVSESWKGEGPLHSTKDVWPVSHTHS